MKRFVDPKYMLIFSMVIFGTIGLFVRNISVSSGELALYRAVLAAALIGCYLIATKQSIPFGAIKKELPLLLFSGIAMAFNWILLFQAYKFTAVSVATLRYYFAPVIVTIACPVLFKERMGAKQWICFVMSTLGIVLITGIGDLSAGKVLVDGVSACSPDVALICGLATLFSVILFSVYGKKMTKLIPFILGILVGYVVASIFTVIGIATNNVALQVIDFSVFKNM